MPFKVGYLVIYCVVAILQITLKMYTPTRSNGAVKLPVVTAVCNGERAASVKGKHIPV